MSVEEELQEHIEHAKDPFDKRVAGSMAILAAGLAIVSVMGHLATTEEIVSQARASDQWAYYQAKSIRRYESEIARDILAAQPEKMAAYQKNVGKYTKEGEEIQKEAQGLEDESHLKGRQASAPGVLRSVFRSGDRTRVAGDSHEAQAGLVDLDRNGGSWDRHRGHDESDQVAFLVL